MGLFKKLFGGSSDSKTPRGFHNMEIAEIKKITGDTVLVTLTIPENLKSEYNFVPGQYITFCVYPDGSEQRRSYSICSGTNEPLSVLVKKVTGGKVSTWFNEMVKAGDSVLVSTPEGNFTRPDNASNIVAIAAGSGITPILSIAKDIEANGGHLSLLYGSRTEDTILLKDEIDRLENTTAKYYLSGEDKDGYEKGRISKDALSSFIKSDLGVLKSDAFFLCGPEALILDSADTLKLYGVPETKIFYELFTEPVLMKPKSEGPQEIYEGTTTLEIILDGESEEFTTNNSKSILEEALNQGLDAPYSCRGGVCSTCKAKVTEGKAMMKLNYSLTDKEVEEGYILTCQAHASTEKLTVNYDEE